MIALIAGLLRLDGASPGLTTVKQMLDAMHPEHLPANQALTLQGPFAAGVLHLAPDGSDTPHKPDIPETGGNFLIADAHFYDGPENPHERILSVLPKIEQDAGEQLHGDFAFASWDGSCLTLCRDQFGVRPLQYSVRDGEYVAFASLPGALLQTGLADRLLDAETLKTYPKAAMAVQPRTFFHQIKTVPAAHTVSISADGHCTSKRYWRLPLNPLIRADEPADALAHEMRSLLDQAVQRRLPKEGQVAAHLSGGLDSGAVAALAAATLRDHNQRLPAFCLAEQRGDPALEIVDELPYAEAIAKQSSNIDLEVVDTPDQVELMQQLDPDLVFSVCENEPEEQILQRAACEDASVILSGWGGDEVATWRGHSNLAELFWTGQWRALAQALKQQSKDSGRSRFAIFRQAVAVESLPGKLRNMVRSRRGRQRPEWQDLIAALVPPANRAALNAVPEREYGADSRVQRRGALEHWSLSGRLEAFAQRGARHGIRYAFPMLDLDLLRFAVRIPAVLLKADGRNRAIFRRAMQGILPDEVRLKDRKLAPYPCETLRQSLQKTHMLEELERLRDNPLITRFIDIDGLENYISAIREPDEIRAWMNETAEAGDQVIQHELYHVFAVWLAWYLDQHDTEAA